MKFDRLPTRRKPFRKTMFARLFNKTKKQRASAATANPEDMDGPGINISRSLTIIFAIHILAIGMIFIHKQYLSGRTPAPVSNVEKAVPTGVAAAPARNNEMPSLSNGDRPYVVKKDDNYAVIARKFNVDESELRQMNPSADIRSGRVLRIPHGRRIIAEVPPEVAAIRDQLQADDSELGLVEILPPVSTTEAQLIRPTRAQLDAAPRANVVASGRSHVIRSGDNLWRISNTYKVSQKDLVALNNITDPTKLKIGQVIKLP